ncbi:ferrochelatase [Tomitella fengzijianii]|uniref:Coproporphyrin III ferrochelatase n=1 Tax=Tomitella fengzijianii TaxID=2597660 RepID=A0A516X2X0_9ACTN|nr:ferrochelatase [Tomitella fengzijianii]QDQ97414.1 ferrochelatase [Tomitella fengzijianii]
MGSAVADPVREPGARALLFASFGGPEGPDDVRPFLENVTRGRNVPPDRLDAVAEHYLHFGGVSPINALNRALIDAVRARLRAEGIDLPVRFGNRNWHPLIEDAVTAMASEGIDGALVFATSAWAGYSGCRQYQEDIARARAAAGERAPELVRLRQFHDHPLFIDAFADAVRDGLSRLGAERPRLVFTAHSVPDGADQAAGPPADGGRLYSRQVEESARLVAQAAGIDEHDVVWQSRSGPPHIPWLGPDICDHLDEVAARRHDGVLVCPVGFISDHLEVIWDLDTEAREHAAGLGIAFGRAATPGTDPRLAEMIVELVREHLDGATPRRSGNVPQYGCTRNGAPCAVGCCAAPSPPRRTVGQSGPSR